MSCMLCVGSALRLEALGCGAKADEEGAGYSVWIPGWSLGFSISGIRLRDFSYNLEASGLSLRP